MQIDSELELSAAQTLAAIGDTLSRAVRVDTFHMPGIERPSIVVQAPVRPSSSGHSHLGIELFESIDGQHFRRRCTLLEPVDVSPALPRLLVVGTLPPRPKGYLQLRYRVTGAPLTGGRVTAYLTTQPPATRQVYHASAFTV